MSDSPKAETAAKRPHPTSSKVGRARLPYRATERAPACAERCAAVSMQARRLEEAVAVAGGDDDVEGVAFAVEGQTARRRPPRRAPRCCGTGRRGRSPRDRRRARMRSPVRRPARSRRSVARRDPSPPPCPRARWRRGRARDAAAVSTRPRVRRSSRIGFRRSIGTIMLRCPAEPRWRGALQLQRADAEKIAGGPDQRRAAPEGMGRGREDRLVEDVFPIAREFLLGHDARRDRALATAEACRDHLIADADAARVCRAARAGSSIWARACTSPKPVAWS